MACHGCWFQRLEYHWDIHCQGKSVLVGIRIKKTQKTILGTITGYGWIWNMKKHWKKKQATTMLMYVTAMCKIYIPLPAPLDSPN
jgi:hypothetical protein